jgi:hypothetical protein
VKPEEKKKKKKNYYNPQPEDPEPQTYNEVQKRYTLKQFC